LSGGFATCSAFGVIVTIGEQDLSTGLLESEIFPALSTAIT